jgi:hypothetical protein
MILGFPLELDNHNIAVLEYLADPGNANGMGV